MKSYYDEKREILQRRSSNNLMRSVHLTPIQTYHVEAKKKKTFIDYVKDFFSKKNEITHNEINIQPPEQFKNDSTNEEAFTHSITSYSGADIVLSVGTKTIGEAQAISWYKTTELESSMLGLSDYYDKELATQKPVVVLLTLAVFDKDHSDDLLKGNFDITMTFANEYGSSHYRAIYDIQLLNEISGTSVDDVCIETTLLACAREVTKLTPSVRCQNPGQTMRAKIAKELANHDS